MLFDYVPYAEYHSYWQMFVNGEIETPKFPNSQLSIPSHFFNLIEDDIFEKYESIQKTQLNFFTINAEGNFISCL